MTNETTISGTLGTVQLTAEGAKRTGSLYGPLWRGVPRELGFLLFGLPIGVAGLGVLSGLFFPGIGTVVIWIGLFLVVAALYVARAFGTVELVRLAGAGSRKLFARGGGPRQIPAGSGAARSDLSRTDTTGCICCTV